MKNITYIVLDVLLSRIAEYFYPPGPGRSNVG